MNASLHQTVGLIRFLFNIIVAWDWSEIIGWISCYVENSELISHSSLGCTEAAAEPLTDSQHLKSLGRLTLASDMSIFLFCSSSSFAPLCSFLPTPLCCGLRDRSVGVLSFPCLYLFIHYFISLHPYKQSLFTPCFVQKMKT